ncbi:hypothetical protein SD70_14940 [Gordoniibacillus kamchatkensis]|uniref:Uncharacterized protein n=1 Tax=Gordoniibacillus kamchatkensis TaxID=1590651 RepID=A0ABR5AGW9_9BACL|nr:hypothetical protein [Paenibacillus sp. VKM B-2647]KIL40247.1 hypothetical protein SD70_14940 [Paenibacillus sp. VKM B-2647]
MSRYFSGFFLRTNNVLGWLYSDGLFGMKKAGNILSLLFLLVGLTVKIFSSIEYLNRIMAGIMMLFVLFLFFIAGFRVYVIKPPKLIRGSSKTPSELFNTFSHGAYIYGIIIFSFISSYFTGGIVLVVSRFFLNNDFNLSRVFYYLFFFYICNIYSFIFYVPYRNEKGIHKDC